MNTTSLNTTNTNLTGCSWDRIFKNWSNFVAFIISLQTASSKTWRNTSKATTPEQVIAERTQRPPLQASYNLQKTKKSCKRSLKPFQQRTGSSAGRSTEAVRRRTRAAHTLALGRKQRGNTKFQQTVKRFSDNLTINGNINYVRKILQQKLA